MISAGTGNAFTFSAVILLILVWVISGPFFGFSDTWQLIANTFTSVVTFVMVFLIQNTQNRDTRATQLKLDELISAMADARNDLIDAENEPEEMVAREKQAIVAEKQRAADRSRNGEPAQHR